VRDDDCLLGEIVKKAAATLSEAGLSTPQLDAELLAAFVLGTSRGVVQARSITGAVLGPDDQVAIGEAVTRRAAREPLQHITGRAAFRSLSLAVGPGVFVPRPETELVAQHAIDIVRADASPEPIAIDLGTGSGAIALALATEVPNARVFAAENSVEAFRWAERNFREVGVANARLELSDLACAFPERDGQVAVVVSNPPYIPSSAIPRDPEVRLFDPPQALYGGDDGLDVVRALSLVAQRLLRRGGSLILEHGEQQGDEIRALLLADGWRAPTTHQDYTRRDRVTITTK